MTAKDLERLATTRFEKLEEDAGEWHVNSYSVDAVGTVRRETLFDNLTRKQASEIVDSLNRMVFDVKRIVKKYGVSLHY